MPAEKPFNRYYKSKQGALLPLELRQRPLEYRRRIAGVEFKQGLADVGNFPRVRKYLSKVVDDYPQSYGEYDDLFEQWHGIRVQILDNFGKPDFIQISKNLIAQFNADNFTDPDTGRYLEDKFQKVQPVITEITYLVSRGNN